MIESDEFYLVLPSNSSTKLYDNTTTSFVTHLNREIRLSGRWCVGIAEIHIPQTILHLKKDEASMEFLEKTEDITRQYPKERTYKYQWGAYESLRELTDAVNGIPVFKDHYYLRPPTYNGGVYSLHRICKCDYSHRAYPGEKLAQIFGFDRSVIGLQKQYNETTGKESLKVVPVWDTDIDTKIIIAEKPACLARALPSQLFVYSDICEPYPVGDTQASLLRICRLNVKYQFGTAHLVRFAPIHYIPLLTTSFQDIGIDIRDEFGDPIPFQYGTLTVTLHFKRNQ